LPLAHTAPRDRGAVSTKRWGAVSASTPAVMPSPEFLWKKEGAKLQTSPPGTDL